MAATTQARLLVKTFVSKALIFFAHSLAFGMRVWSNGICFFSWACWSGIGRAPPFPALCSRRVPVRDKIFKRLSESLQTTNRDIVLACSPNTAPNIRMIRLEHRGGQLLRGVVGGVGWSAMCMCDNYNPFLHRSHFGSRYTLGCCRHAGLFLQRFEPR